MMIWRPFTCWWCNGEMFALDCVDIHQRYGAMISKSGAHVSRMRKLVTRSASPSFSRGWPGKEVVSRRPWRCLPLFFSEMVSSSLRAFSSWVSRVKGARSGGIGTTSIRGSLISNISFKEGQGMSELYIAHSSIAHVSQGTSGLRVSRVLSANPTTTPKQAGEPQAYGDMVYDIRLHV